MELPVVQGAVGHDEEVVTEQIRRLPRVVVLAVPLGPDSSTEQAARSCLGQRNQPQCGGKQ